MKVIKILAAITAAAALAVFFTSDAFARDGVYKLEHTTIVWPDGGISTSKAHHFQVSGIMKITGRRVQQHLNICGSNGCAEVYADSSDYWPDAHREVMRHIDEGGVERQFHILSNDPLISVAGRDGATEIDEWKELLFHEHTFHFPRSAVAKSATVGEKTPTSVVEALTLLGAN